MVVEAHPAKYFGRPYLKKYPTQKSAGRVAQAVEHLPSNYEALGSNSSIVLKKKKRERERERLRF
jgi:hypothetical protein